MANLVSAEEIAVEHGLPVGRILYLTWQQTFPRPVRRTSRDRWWDPDEVATYLRVGGFVRC
ncbi:hypothetical protein ABIC10_006596 [Bradyrhizobium sp. S3.2.12]